MYYTPTEMRKAKKQHQCTNCAEEIAVGETYARWMSVDDGKAFTNKMHMECLSSLLGDSDDGFFEYSPYGGERPILDNAAIKHEDDWCDDCKAYTHRPENPCGKK